MAGSGTTGLRPSVGNAVFNKTDNVLVVVDNFYSAATGGQDILSSRATSRRNTGNPIARAVTGVGVKWVREVDRTYDLTRMVGVLQEALTTREKGPSHRRVVRMHAEPPASRAPAMAKAAARRENAW